MPILRRVLSGILVGLYGVLAGSLLGFLVTFWMRGIGIVFGVPAGLGAAVLGWYMPLRDAVILFAGCFSGLVMIKWVSLALDWRSPAQDLALLAVVILSAPSCGLLQKHLTLSARLRLAIVLLASGVLNLIMFAGIRA